MRRIALYCLVLFALLPLIVCHCRVNETVTMVPDTPAALAKRSTDSLISNEALPWPLQRFSNGLRYRAVRYCYKDKEARDIIHCDLQEAIIRWLHVIARDSTVGFWEAKDGGHNPLYCRAGSDWNYALPVDTLEIQYDPTWEDQSVSTVGYKDPTGKQGGYNYMKVGHYLRSQKRTDVLTHEVSWGHHFRNKLNCN